MSSRSAMRSRRPRHVHACCEALASKARRVPSLPHRLERSSQPRYGTCSSTAQHLFTRATPPQSTYGEDGKGSNLDIATTQAQAASSSNAAIRIASQGKMMLQSSGVVQSQTPQLPHEGVRKVPSDAEERLGVVQVRTKDPHTTRSPWIEASAPWKSCISRKPPSAGSART